MFISCMPVSSMFHAHIILLPAIRWAGDAIVEHRTGETEIVHRVTICGRRGCNNSFRRKRGRKFCTLTLGWPCRAADEAKGAA